MALIIIGLSVFNVFPLATFALFGSAIYFIANSKSGDGISLFFSICLFCGIVLAIISVVELILEYIA